VSQQVKIEIKGKDEFWGRAFHVEWESQFPDRKLGSDGAGRFLSESAWLADLERVAAETYCKVVRAREHPDRFVIGTKPAFPHVRRARE
jgi:hypothetical protein